MSNIIVTGAGKGIGFDTVCSLAENPSNKILAISRNIDALARLENKNVIPVQLDLLEYASYMNILNVVNLNLDKKVDVLINNAGFLTNKPAIDINEIDFQNTFQTNVFVPLKLVQLLLNNFSANAHIVNIGSMGGINHTSKFPGLNIYSASKAALAVLSECLAVELQKKNIKVNCLALGSADTEMVKEAFPGYQAQVSSQTMGQYISNFATTAQNVINGQVIPVAMLSV